MQLYPSIWAEEERNHLQPYTFYPHAQNSVWSSQKLRLQQELIDICALMETGLPPNCICVFI